jgi:hypothetical protein
MGALLNTPSAGKSEVLETLRYEGAIHGGVPIYRLEGMVSHRWMGDEDRTGSDSVFTADLKSVLGTLQGLGYVIGADNLNNTVDLTASPPMATNVILTGPGRVAARAPRPRPRRISG